MSAPGTEQSSTSSSSGQDCDAKEVPKHDSPHAKSSKRQVLEGLSKQQLLESVYILKKHTKVLKTEVKALKNAMQAEKTVFLEKLASLEQENALLRDALEKSLPSEQNVGAPPNFSLPPKKISLEAVNTLLAPTPPLLKKMSSGLGGISCPNCSYVNSPGHAKCQICSSVLPDEEKAADHDADSTATVAELKAALAMAAQTNKIIQADRLQLMDHNSKLLMRCEYLEESFKQPKARSASTPDGSAPSSTHSARSSFSGIISRSNSLGTPEKDSDFVVIFEYQRYFSMILGWRSTGKVPTDPPHYTTASAKKSLKPSMVQCPKGWVWVDATWRIEKPGSNAGSLMNLEDHDADEAWEYSKTFIRAKWVLFEECGRLHIVRRRRWIRRRQRVGDTPLTVQAGSAHA